MRLKNDVKLLDLINAKIQAEFNDVNNELRNKAQQQILKLRTTEIEKPSLRCKRAA